jgi:hypothetical protein
VETRGSLQHWPRAYGKLGIVGVCRVSGGSIPRFLRALSSSSSVPLGPRSNPCHFTSVKSNFRGSTSINQLACKPVVRNENRSGFSTIAARKSSTVVGVVSKDQNFAPSSNLALSKLACSLKVALVKTASCSKVALVKTAHPVKMALGKTACRLKVALVKYASCSKVAL